MNSFRRLRRGLVSMILVALPFGGIGAASAQDQASLELCMGKYDARRSYCLKGEGSPRGIGRGTVLNRLCYEHAGCARSKCTRPECLLAGTDCDRAFLDACEDLAPWNTASLLVCDALWTANVIRQFLGQCDLAEINRCPVECRGCIDGVSLCGGCRRPGSLEGCPDHECCSIPHDMCSTLGDDGLGRCWNEPFERWEPCEYGAFKSIDSICDLCRDPEHHPRTVILGGYDPTRASLGGIEGVDWILDGHWPGDQCAHDVCFMGHYCKGNVVFRPRERTPCNLGDH